MRLEYHPVRRAFRSTYSAFINPTRPPGHAEVRAALLDRSGRTHRTISRGARESDIAAAAAAIPPSRWHLTHQRPDHLLDRLRPWITMTNPESASTFPEGYQPGTGTEALHAAIFAKSTRSPDYHHR